MYGYEQNPGAQQQYGMPGGMQGGMPNGMQGGVPGGYGQQQAPLYPEPSPRGQ